MDCDSTSSCENRLVDLGGSKKVHRKISHPQKDLTKPSCSSTVQLISGTSQQKPEIPPEASSRIINFINPLSLSSQVMEYYHKYSRSPNLDQYFTLPRESAGEKECAYRWRSRKKAPMPLEEDEKSWEKEICSETEVLKQRGRWIGPPLIGQSSGATTEVFACPYPARNIPSVSPSSPKSANTRPSIRSSEQDTEIALPERSQETPEKFGSLSIELLETEGKAVSPTSSVTSHKPLEWDSGADVGYNNALPGDTGKQGDILCTIERMALTREFCSAALRLDPEGTTRSTFDTRSGNRMLCLSSKTKQLISKPDANSTRLNGDLSESERKIEMTPIVRTNMPGTITGNIIVEDCDQICHESVSTKDQNIQKEKKATMPRAVNTMTENKIVETPKISTKYATEKIMRSRLGIDSQGISNLMKKSASLNVVALTMSFPTLSLSRSQGELYGGGEANNNFIENDRSTQEPLNFASSSSIATIVDKPVTRDVETNLIEEASESPMESVGIQVSSLEKSESDLETESNIHRKNPYNIVENQEGEEEEPALPKRILSLDRNKLQSILKYSGNQNENIHKTESSQSGSRDGTIPSHGDRASNSFEYFPGHVYQNVGQTHGESTSHVSSIDTMISHSTMPNTSSSLDEKLWGDSDSLLRDLEKSLNVLKCLVDANKCNKHVKKRLIHHVIKRLVTVKYNDDKIERNLEENVPWNPDNARNKIYRTEIIQALAKKQRDNDTSEESSEEWKPRKRSSSCVKKIQNVAKSLEKMIQLFASSENSDSFEGRQVDRTDSMQDGRKARMGLRGEDRYRDRETREPINVPNFETRKNESLGRLLSTYEQTENEATTVDSKVSKVPSTTMNSIEESSRRRDRDEKMDWRLPATMSERKFELDQCSHRAGASFELINYVQMEKKNQLVWINNEISHLSNLKKLLEEPRSCSSHKNKDFNHSNASYFDENFSNFPEKRMNKQRSSHRNLFKKREKLADMISEKQPNCCNRSEMNCEYSKIDMMEIRKIPSSNGMRTSSHCAQTIAEICSKELSPNCSPRRLCAQHGNKSESCTCPRLISSSYEPATRPRNKSVEVRKSVASQSFTKSKKENKNQLNDRCRSEFNDSEYQERFPPAEGSRHCKSCRCASVTDSSCSGEIYENIEGEGGKKGRSSRHNKYTFSKARRGARSCRICGILRSSDDPECLCVQGCIKPIAYELSFEDQAERKSPQHTKKENMAQRSLSSSESPEIMQSKLKDYMEKNKPELVNKMETRKRYMSEISHLRELKKEKRNQFLALVSPSSLIVTQTTPNIILKSSTMISDREMKTRLRLRYLRLNEVKNKHLQKKKEEQARKNHIMARIFGMKLQRKVLQGQVDLSQGSSVISDL